MAVLLIGTLDTKGEELAFLRSRLRQAGVDVLLADVGTGDPPTVEPDIAREEISEHVADDRGAAVRAMAEGAAEVCDAMLRSAEQGAHEAVTYRS